MSVRRLLSWSTAIRDICADRIAYAPGERAANLRRKAFAQLAAKRARSWAQTSPLIVAGRYSRSAIMTAAIAAAKARRAATGEAWGTCLSAALKGTWEVARAERLAGRPRCEPNTALALGFHAHHASSPGCTPAGQGPSRPPGAGASAPISHDRSLSFPVDPGRAVARTIPASPMIPR